MVWTLFAVFLGGLALNLTPCVYPLVPVTVSFFGAKAVQERKNTATHAIFYILGLALANSILGVVAAMTGSLMGSVLQNPVAVVFVAIVLVAFAASLFGYWELRLPSRLTTAASRSYAGYFGSLFMGLTLGVVAAPCLGPFVLGLLTWVAKVGSPWLGFAVFFTLSLGLGVPLFVLAVFSGSIDKLPGSGEWMLWVRKVMGWVLIGMAAYFIGPLLPPKVGIILLAAVALGAGIHLGWIDRTESRFRGFRLLRRGVGVAGLALALILAVPALSSNHGVSWQPYSDGVLAQARQNGQPVILEFSAGWCPSCRELEKTVFTNPEVIKSAKSDFVMVKVDLTRRDNPAYQRLVDEYGVRGVPTVVFLDAQGMERLNLRLVGYTPPETFLTLMGQARTPSGPTAKTM
jgi:thioredoxin:protein disulfide reductase